jgi:hypothetical protein
MDVAILLLHLVIDGKIMGNRVFNLLIYQKNTALYVAFMHNDVAVM